MDKSIKKAVATKDFDLCRDQLLLKTPIVQGIKNQSNLKRLSKLEFCGKSAGKAVARMVQEHVSNLLGQGDSNE